jgi:hypothetical protein
MGIDNAGALGQGAGSGQAAGGSDVAIPLASHEQHRYVQLLQLSLAVVALSKGSA